MYDSHVGVLPRPEKAPPISLARVWLAPLAFLALSACTATPVAVCPAIVPYTAEQQVQAANELDALPPGAVLPRFMTDYGVLRAKLRACQ